MYARLVIITSTFHLLVCSASQNYSKLSKVNVRPGDRVESDGSFCFSKTDLENAAQ